MCPNWKSVTGLSPARRSPSPAAAGTSGVGRWPGGGAQATQKGPKAGS
eukprot:CAMPEP_0172946770 /NCGR_PEP_ID=MMETSP1075-20121228/227229_1 /TAXON_ID=2916 /ORGANISM="Ceratium fusus, Strain PA161109" /LENGTH=47 /DNA_ID= /DNA_START= /DNA_END= /DNA_ORIENTATION=